LIAEGRELKRMRKISILVIVLAVLLILAVPAMAQPDCSVLTATHGCDVASLEWTAWDDAFGYLLCWGDGNTNCGDYESRLSAGGGLLPGTYKWHIIPVDDVGTHLCESNTATVTIPGVCEPINTPEFPSAFLPATMIIGFLGAVLLIQRTREQ